MKEKWTYNSLRKFIIAFLAVAMIMSGACLLDTDGNTVFATETTTESTTETMSTEPIYVLVDNIEGYRSESGYTFPKPTGNEAVGKEDWVFAGWYYEDTDSDTGYTAYRESEMNDVSSAYAKYVSPDVLSAKFQVTAGTNEASEKASLRVVSTIDSTNYKKVGFRLTSERTGVTQTKESSTVYKRILSATEGLDYGYSPVIFDTEAEYFMTITIANIKNANFDYSYIATPYWITLDGTTVNGVTRSAKVSDSYNGIANIPVRLYTDATVEAGTITVTYDSTAFTYKESEEFTFNETKEDILSTGATVTDGGATDGVGTVTVTLPEGTSLAKPDGMLVNLRFTVLEAAESNEKFEITSTDVSGVSDTYYRTFSSYYTGTPDTSWYDEFKEQNKFVLATADDLYGFAKLVNEGTDNFEENEVYLGADLMVNAVEEGTVDAWQAETGTLPESWTPIGAEEAFAGTFDGQMHTISGIYLNTDTPRAGIFGVISSGGSVSKLYITNSLFKYTKSSDTSKQHLVNKVAFADIGSVAGICNGTVDTVYSDAVIVTDTATSGGIVGYMQTSGANVNNCWFNGIMELTTADALNSGGIVGYMASAKGDTFSITNCLYTGELSFTTTATSDWARRIGGIVGGAWDYKKEIVVNLENCLSAGTMKCKTESATGMKGISSVYGGLDNYDLTLNLVNVYGTNECYAAEKQIYYAYQGGGNNTINGTGTLMAQSELSGYENRSAVKSLGIYTNHAKDNKKAWVITEAGVPQLKAFCDEWLDFGWYDEYTEGDYKIETAEEMYAFSLASKSDQFSGDTVKLVDNIKLNNGTASVWATTENTGITDSLRTWTPIGQTTAFTGTFDGNGCTISGLYVNETTTNGVGLFGQVSGKVQNFRLNNSYVNSIKMYTGSVVGFLYGNMDGVYSDAYIDGTADDLGGLVGRFGAKVDKTISNSWFAGNVEAAGQNNVGGIVGYATSNNKTINNCLNTGSISGGVRAGGLVGYTSSITNLSLTNCLHMGKVDPAQSNAGAVVGYINGKTTIKNVYTNEDVKENQTNGITGVGWTSVSSNNPITGEPVLLAETQVTGMNAYINTDLDYYDTDATDNAWAIVSGGTPVIKKLYDGAVETSLSGLKVSSNWYYNAAYRSTSLVNEETEYEIQDVADFRGMAAIVNNGVDSFAGDEITVSANTTEFNLSEGWTVTADESGTVTQTGTANAWTPIGNTTAPFAGTFDGNGCEISGVYINSTTANTGLFGYCTGTVKDFSLTNSYIESNKKATGSIVGCADDGAQVENIYSKAYVITTATKEDANTGGIVGHVNCLSDNTNATGNTYITGCWFDGLVKSSGSKQYVGGILGRHEALNVTINDCLFTGKVTTKTTANAYTGGIVGGLYAWYANGVVLRISNTVSNGEVVVDSTATYAIGSVIGASAGNGSYTRNVYMQNVYDATSVTSENTLTLLVNGAGKHSGSNYNLTGIPMPYADGDLDGDNAYKYTNLIFRDSVEDTAGTGAWVATENGPELYNFSDTSTTSKFTDVIKVEKDWYYNAVQYSGGTKQIVEYGIANVNDFRGLPTIVNDGVDDFSGYTIKVSEGATINLSEGWTVTADEGGTVTQTGTANAWTPIGNTTAPFAGTFNGNGCEISGVYINSTTSNTGLFGYCTGTVQNFSLTNSYITSSLDSTGSVVGYADDGARVENIYSNAYVVCTRSSSDANIGGIVGQVFSSDRTNATGNAYITGCWFEGLVKSGGTSQYTGGILGRHQALNVTISDCLFTGKVLTTSTKNNPNTGGIVGGLYAWWANGVVLRINNTISDGEVAVDSSATSAIGSVIGASGGGSSCTRTVNMENVYDATEITSQKTLTQKTKSVGAISNRCTLEGTTILYDEADLYGTWGYQNTVLNFKDTWAARENAVPGLAAFVDEPVSIDTTYRPDTSWYDENETELTIADAADMYGFMQLLVEGKTFEGMTITVTADLVMNQNLSDDSVSTWQNGTAVPNNKWLSGYTGKTTNFAGTFDGKGHTISGIYCVGDYEYLGLFGTTLTGSTVKNFKLTDSYFKQTGTGNTGSIAGAVQGTIDSVYTDAIIESAGLYVGGIAAYTSGTIYGTNVVSTEDTSETEKTVTATAYRDVVNIKNCWFDGVINATTEKTWARIGGLVGYVSEGRLDMANCLFTGKIDAQEAAASARVGGFVGTRNSNAKPTTSTTSTTDGIKTTTTITSTYEDTGEEAYPMLYLVSSIAAGEITVSGNEDTVGSAIGYVEYGKFDDVFVTRDTYPITHSVATATFTGQPIQTYNTDRLVGYCVEPTYGFTLDFEGEDATWSMRTSGVPVPKALEGVVGAENIVDVSTLTAEIGLGTWNKTLAEAEDYGMGNYVVSADATYDKYTAYLTKLDDTPGFDLYADNSASDMDDDGVYNAIYTKASGDWVLDITFVQNESKIYISISTIGEEGLADNLEATEANLALANAEEETTKEVSFSMLELNGNNGNSFVFKLPNGHFIINDGGKKKASADDGTELINELDPLLDYLQELAGTEKVVIDAWIFSHTHDDHIAVAVDIFGDAEWKENVSLNAIYLTEANDETKLLDGTSAINYVNESFRGLLSLTQEDRVSKPAIHRMHMGERYYFSGMTMDVVQAHEQIALDVYTDTENYDDPDRFNATSTNCVYTLTNTGKKILIGGDSNNINMQYMMMAYGKSYTTYNASSQQYGGTSKTLSNINVFAAYHHGKNVISTYKAYRPSLIDYVRKAEGTNEWADYLLKNTNNPDGFKFDLVLFSYKEVFDMNKYTGEFISGGTKYNNIWVGDDGVSIMHPYNLSELNQYYIDNSEAYYTYGYEDHDADGNILELENLTRHGTVQFIYRENKTVDTVINESKITQ